MRLSSHLDPLMPPDFTIKDPSFGRASTFAQKMKTVLKTVFFPIWAPYAACKHGVQRIAMIPVYPAQSRILQNQIDYINPVSLHYFRKQLLQVTQEEGLIINEVIIQRNNTPYHGLMISHPET